MGFVVHPCRSQSPCSYPNNSSAGSRAGQEVLNKLGSCPITYCTSNALAGLTIPSCRSRNRKTLGQVEHHLALHKSHFSTPELRQTSVAKIAINDLCSTASSASKSG